jgi:hypothetical protein
MLNKIKKKYYLRKLETSFRDDPEILENWIETINNYHLNSVQYNVGRLYNLGSNLLLSPYLYCYPDILTSERGDADREKDTRKAIRTKAVKLSFFGLGGAKIYFEFIKNRKDHRTSPEHSCGVEYFSPWHRFEHPISKLSLSSDTPIAISHHKDGLALDQTITLDIKFNPTLLGDKLYILCNAFKYHFHSDKDNPLIWKESKQDQIEKMIDKYPSLSIYFNECRELKNLLKSYDEDNLVAYQLSNQHNRNTDIIKKLS